MYFDTICYIERKRFLGFDTQHGLFNFRSEKSVREHLSDACTKRRCRQTKIGIQTSIIAWIVELLGSMTVTLIYNLSENAPFKNQWMFCIVTSIYFVLIPGSYLLATDRLRESILDQGWRNLLKCPCHSARVAPLPNIPIELNDINRH